MRLQRVGRKNNPSYRVVVTDSRTGPKSGKHVDLLGSYDPKVDRVQVDGDRAKAWLQKGVQASPTVHNMLINAGIIEGKKVNVLPKKSPIVDEEAEAAKKAAEEAAAAAAAAPAEETPAEEAPAEEAPATEAPEAPAEEPQA